MRKDIRPLSKLFSMVEPLPFEKEIIINLVYSSCLKHANEMVLGDPRQADQRTQSFPFPIVIHQSLDPAAQAPSSFSLHALEHSTAWSGHSHARESRTCPHAVLSSTNAALWLLSSASSLLVTSAGEERPWLWHRSRMPCSTVRVSRRPGEKAMNSLHCDGLEFCLLRHPFLKCLHRSSCTRLEHPPMVAAQNASTHRRGNHMHDHSQASLSLSLYYY